MRRIVVAALVALVGIVFVAMTFTQNLFRVGTDFEEMITDFRPILEEEALSSYRADIEAFGAVATEFQAALVPGLALALGVSPDELQASLVAQYPAVGQGMAALPAMTEQFGGLVNLLAAQRANFASADAIPATSLVAQTVPWGFAAAGVIAIGLGLAMWVWRFRVASVAAMAFGLLIVLGSFLLSLPGKSADADALNDALKPAYTADTVAAARAGLAVMGAMGDQMAAEMLPALAGQLGMTGDELNAFLAEGFPATARVIGGMEVTLERFRPLAGVFEANLENYDTLRPVAFTPVIWIFIVGGFVIALAGAYGSFGRQEAEAGAEAEA